MASPIISLKENLKITGCVNISGDYDLDVMSNEFADALEAIGGGGGSVGVTLVR